MPSAPLASAANPQATTHQPQLQFQFLKQRQFLKRISIRLTMLLCLSTLLMFEPSATSPVKAATLPLLFANSHGQIQSDTEFWQQLQQAQVIYLGETHDRADDHVAQLRLIQQLHQRNPHLVIGMEMFQRPYQHVLDRYLRGDLNESELLDRTEYRTRWGFDWELYAPIVRYAKAQQIRIVALNTPAEVTRKVSRQGLGSLGLSDRRFIPPLSAIKTEPDAYRQMLQAIFQAAHQGHDSSDRFEQFFQAQVLWDETMAERITQILKQQTPPPQVVVLVGQGHLVYRYGIPSRVSRRFSDRLQQQVILLSPDPDMAKTDDNGQPIADLLRQSAEVEAPNN
jgi:uncharacterized iron-regulated protein